MFNKKRPYGTIHGTNVAGAMYQQDGHAYDVDYNYVWSNPDAPPLRGVERKTLEQAEREHQERLAAIARGEVIPQKKAETEERKTPPLPPDTTGQELTVEQKLMQANVPKLQEMQFEALKQINAQQTADKQRSEKDLRKDVIKGPGSKEKLVKWLVENGDFSESNDE